MPRSHQDRKYRRGQRAKMAAQVHRVATAALRDLGSQLADIDERMRALMTAETLANLQLDKMMLGTVLHDAINERKDTIHAMLRRLSLLRGELAERVTDWRSIRRTLVNCPDCRGKGQRWRQGILSGGTFVCTRCCGAGVLVAGVD